MRVAVVLGTRPEAIKLAPVIHAARSRPEEFEVSVVSTGQHHEMLWPMLEWFGIEPDIDLRIMQPNQSLAQLTGAALSGLDGALGELDPDWVVVQGDTTSTFVGGLVGFYQGAQVAHVEAGLRTGHKRSPFPEELNRLLTTRIADLHCAPTERTRLNLLREGIPERDILVTGNTCIDALHWTADRLGPAEPQEGREILVTTHRRENQGAPMEATCRAVLELVNLYDDLHVHVPMHLSPTVREVVTRLLFGHPRIHITEPLDYPQFVAAMKRATFVMSDSGGVQEEAPALGCPVLVLRQDTERPEAVEAGANVLVGTDRHQIVTEARRLLDHPHVRARMASAGSPYGDGRAAHRILDAVLDRSLVERRELRTA